MTTDDGQVTLDATRKVRHPPAEVWGVVGDGGGLAAWVPGVRGGQVVGAVRTVTFTDGSEAADEVVASAPELHRHTHRCLRGPLPVAATSRRSTSVTERDRAAA